jgi:hypothetical protein
MTETAPDTIAGQSDGGHTWFSGKTWPFLLGIGLTLAFTLAIIRPWEDPLPPPEDVSALWSESVSRLGIEPLFPPQEDFHVGDVYVVISAYDEADGITREKGPDRPLLRKSAKIGHLDLRGISMGTAGAPVFAQTLVDKDGATVLHQAREEVTASTNGNIKVSVVSFPAITIRNSTGDSSAWDDWVPFSASRNLSNEEVITIRLAESYGASIVEATLALDRWCKNDLTKLYCTDAFARKMLGYTTNSDVLEVRGNRYTYRISLKLITQVYLTRAIDFSRSSEGDVSAAVGDSGEASPPQGDGPAPGAVGASGATAPPEPARQPARRGVSTDRSAHTAMAIGNAVYPRPVVFGFKSVTFALDPSMPQSTAAKGEPQQSGG